MVPCDDLKHTRFCRQPPSSLHAGARLEKLTFEHTIKADAIPDAIYYENYEKKVFGKVYRIEGNVASNVQFSLTDSTNHMISAALYFYVKPNYDSILPAIRYLEKDIDHLIESLEWKDLKE